MSWIRKNLFADRTDPASHMVALIEAERARTPFGEADRQILLQSWHPEIPEDFETKIKKLIEQTLDHEADPDDPRSLGNSVVWAGDTAYPAVVALTEEVLRERG
jgi:hypothetical protein